MKFNHLLQRAARPGALLVTCAALAGCAALHIDVDVYKGPLVNHEDVQRDQLLAMALSAKPMLLELRGQLFRTAHASYLPNDLREWRNKALPQREFERLVDHWAPEGEAARRAMRNARTLNSILSAFEDKGESTLHELARELRQLEDEAEELHQRYLALSRSGAEANPSTRAALQAAHLARVPIWQALLDVLRQVPAAQQWTDQDRRRYAELRRHAAQWVAERTQPWLLACVLGAQAVGSSEPAAAARGDRELVRLADEMRRQAMLQQSRPLGDGTPLKRIHADPERSVSSPPADALFREWGFGSARQALAGALEADHHRHVEALARAHALMRLGRPAGCPMPVPGTGQNDTEVTRPWLNQAGLVREPSRSRAGLAGDDGQAESESHLLAAQLQFLADSDGGGFDRGRTADGIDRQSDRYALQRDAALGLEGRAARSGGQDRPQETAQSKARSEFRRMEHKLVDLAARMQFLANNLWLVETATGTVSTGEAAAELVASSAGLKKDDIDRYKALLEAVANNLMVHADDLRHRAKYEQRQADGAAAERHAAGSVLQQRNVGQVFEALNRELSRLQAEAKAAEDGVANAKKSLDELDLQIPGLKKTAEELSLAHAGAIPPEAQLALLVTTLGARSPAPESALSGEDNKAWIKDSDRINKQLNQGAATVTQAALRTELQGLLTAMVKELADATSLRHTRLASALLGLQRLGAPPADPPEPALARKDQVQSLRVAVNLAWEKQHKASDEANTRLSAAMRAMQQAQNQHTALDEKTKTKPAALTSAQYTDVRAAVQAQQAGVTKAVQDLGSEVSTQVVVHELRRLVNEQKLPAADDFNKAMAAVTLPRFLPALAAAAPAASTLEVLDARIATLRHQLIDALALGGVDSSASKNLSAALELARKERESQLYIRPASAYLRSVYSSTATQDGAARGQNLLFDVVKRMTERDPNGPLKESLDKASWQNVNTVSVSAAGEANFVVVKDDVGNWTVKAMGADPAAMVRAAKNLALYNMGGRYNTNLLRLDAIDQRMESEKDQSVRQELRDERKALSEEEKGAAVESRGETLSLFIANYRKQSVNQLADLNILGVDGKRFEALRTAWQAKVKDTDRIKALEELLDDATLLAVHEQLKKASLPTADDASAPAAVLATLQAARRLHAGVASAVRAHTGLTEEAQQEVTSSKAKLDEEQRKLIGASAVVQAAALGTTDRTGKEEREKQQQALVDTAAKRLAAAEASLAAARTLKSQVLADVDSVLNAPYTAVTKRRLDLVKETETAVKVVGQSGG